MTFFIFASNFGISVSISGDRNEKGIRCNTGAVPAAVSPKTVSESHTTASMAGRCRLPGEPEDLSKFTVLFFAFGKNSKGELHLVVIHSLYWTESL